MIKLSTLTINPDNPRFIKDERFKALVKSIKDFPKMMKLRPLIVDADNVIIGGNMRYRALCELKYKEIPDNWVASAEDFDETERRRFILVDNEGYGEDDYEIIAANYNVEELVDWGIKNAEFFIQESFLDDLAENAMNNLAVSGTHFGITFTFEKTYKEAFVIKGKDYFQEILQSKLNEVLIELNNPS